MKVINYLFFLFIDSREKDRERNIDVREEHWPVASCTLPNWDQTQNPGMGPDWESNLWPVGLRDNAQPTEPHWPGRKSWFYLFLKIINKIKKRLTLMIKDGDNKD